MRFDYLILTEFMKGRIKIFALEIDNDDIQFQIEIENHSCKTSLDFYGNIDEFTKSGQEFIEFPKSITDVVLLTRYRYRTFW